MESPDNSRRDFLKATGAVGLGVGLAGCSMLGGKSELEKQVETARKQTEKYDNNIKGAMEDGFVQLSGPGIKGMGWHLMNPKNLQDAAKNGFTVEKPQALTFDSEQNIGSVEYTAPVSQVSQSPDLFDDESSNESETWTTHTAGTHVAAAPPYDQQTPLKEIPFEDLYVQQNWKEFPEVRDDLSAGDEIRATFPGHDKPETRVIDAVQTHPSLRTLHVWVHADNPDGLFSEVNPEFAQELTSTQHTHE